MSCPHFEPVYPLETRHGGSWLQLWGTDSLVAIHILNVWRMSGTVPIAMVDNVENLSPHVENWLIASHLWTVWKTYPP